MQVIEITNHGNGNDILGYDGNGDGNMLESITTMTYPNNNNINNNNSNNNRLSDLLGFND